MMMYKMISFMTILFIIFAIGTFGSLQPGGRWKQLGNTIIGAVEFERLGYDVAMSSDGNTIATINQFSARIFTYNSSSRSWVQIGSDISIMAFVDHSIAISADGKMFAIGLPYSETVNGQYTGMVRVYAFDSDVQDWEQVGSDINGRMELDQLGSSVTMSADGKTLASSAIYLNKRYVSNVRVFTYSSRDKKWLPVGNTIISGEEGQNHVGASLDMSANGKTIAIGEFISSNGDPALNKAGYVRVYSISSTTKQWTSIGSDIIGEVADDFSGFSIAISAIGRTIAIGAFQNDGNGNNSGHVRVFSFSNVLSNWVQVGNDIDGEAPDDTSGYSVAISDDGKTVAIGAISNNNPNGMDSGHVRVYSYVASTRVWTQIGTDINGIKANDLSGYSLAMSADGSTIIIGAPYSMGNVDDTYGFVRVFKYKPPQDCTTSWRLYNLQNNTIVDSLVNDIKIRKPPPCGYANIEAFVPCAVNTSSHVVTMELYDNQGKLYRRRTDTTSPYFLYGKYGNIKAGTYKIRAIVNSTISPYTSMVSPYTKFTLLGNCA